jgi:hypothetical protein
MRKSLAFCVIFAAAASQPAAAAAAPAPAVPVIVPPAPPVAAKPADHEKLTIAREIARAVWPDGTVKTVMGSVTSVRSNMMDEMMKTTPKDLGVAKGKGSDRSLGDLVRERDPYFEERTAITNRIMADEVGKLLTEMEPQLRESVAELYARKFSKTELVDIAAFFNTPSGKVYAGRLMPMMSDPEYLKSMSGFVPKFLQAMPRITERIKKETAQLPPPKDEDKPKSVDMPST